MNESSLRRLYLDRLIRHAHQHHQDNYSVDRYGPGGEGRVEVDRLRVWQELILDNTLELAWLWDALAEDESREVLLECMLYNSLGHLKVKRRLNTKQFQVALHGGPSCGGAVQLERADAVPGAGLHLYAFDNPRLRLLSSRGFVLTHMLNRQYMLARTSARVCVEPGDVVVDCGGCRGDTALWLAGFAGPEGRVLSLEFVPDNLDFYRTNLAMNPGFAPRVEVVEHAACARVGDMLRFDPEGAGTKVGASGACSVTTTSIDYLVRERGLDRVDYIKMDIEGSEASALRGARETIQAFRPKLAISVYHRPGDWWVLARLVRELLPDYKLHLGHHTIFGEETVLYATAR